MNSSTQLKNLLVHWKNSLILVLGIQLLLVIGIYTFHRFHQPQVEAKSLLDFSVSTVDRILIDDGNSHATLKKSGADWLLPELRALPVDQKKLDELLTKLQGTKLTWPVTSTASSHERFEVTANKFQRRVEFYQGDKKIAELWLGSSPGFKKIHLRRDGENEVYAVELATYDFAAKDTDWFKKDLLAMVNPTFVSGKDYAIQKQDTTWSFTEGISDKADSTKSTELANAIANLTVEAVAANTPNGDVTSVSVKGDLGEHTYDFVKSGDSYYVKRNDRKDYFTLSQSEFERVTRYQKANLIAVTETNSFSSEQSSSRQAQAPAK